MVRDRVASEPAHEPLGLTDRSLRNALIARIAAPAVTVLHEVWVPRSHERADVVAVGEKNLVAFEIKSARDRLTRLARQVQAYEGLFRLCTLVVAQRHLAAAQAELPPWWGVLTTASDGSTLEEVRAPRVHGHVATEQLVRLLWRDEAKLALTRLGLQHDKDATRGVLWRNLLDNADDARLEELVALALRARQGASARIPARWTAQSPRG